jgi:hypothetical protein
MRAATVFDERTEKHDKRANQNPRLTFEQFDDARADKEGEQQKNQNGQSKFHRRAL